MNTEPVLSVSAVTSFATILLALLVSFGLNLSNEQTGMLVALVAIVAKTVGAFYARSKVTPVK